MKLHTGKSVKLLTLTLLTLLLPLSSSTLEAKVKLPPLISDKMVLQRDTELKIWGWANPGEKVTVRFRGNYYDTAAGEDGKWIVTLPPQKPGGPFILEVNEIILRDVLVGDVWLCSGQSNQETPIVRLTDLFPEINVSNNNMIRHYKVPTQDSPEQLQDNIAGNAVWYSGVASEVMNWTALAYFYAQIAYEHTGIPVGMLVSSLGGSAIESWVGQEHLKEFPRLILDKEALEGLKYAQSDKGSGKWNAYDFDDTDWATTTVPGMWRDRGIDARGVVWYRKDFELPQSMDGKHAKLYVGTLVNNDSVFVNGHFVGFTSYEYPPRRYTIPAGILKAGKNVIAVKLTADFGNGGFIPDKPYKVVGDDITVDLEGTWKYKIGKDNRDAAEFEARLTNRKTVGSGLYNGMIYPLRDYKVVGAIWYQGEANTGNAHEYYPLVKALVENWRELWNKPDMPFLFVQLPNFMEKRDQPSDSGWARIREAQLKAARNIDNTALAVTYDLGEWNDIHPLNKKDVAQRLFLGARKLVYKEKVVASGPVFTDMKIEGNKIILSFTNTGSGLTSNGQPLKHFAIAGEDKKFVWADAVIKGNKVIVSHKDVPNPVAVRYAWADNPDDANLKNKEGLLASPFRTDEW